MDGTLLDSDGTLSRRVIEAVQAAQARGVVVTLATARRWAGVTAYAHTLNLDGPLILYDGALLRAYPDGSDALRQPLDAALAQRAAEILTAHELQVVTQHSEAHGERMVASEAPPHPEWMSDYLERFQAQVSYAPLDHLTARSHNTLRVVSFAPEARLREAFDALDELPLGRQILPMGSYGISELTLFATGVSKGAGLRWLARRLGVPLAQTLAIGDGVNDVSMLRAAGLGVAMGNAAPEIKREADALTAANDADGAALAIERYILGVETRTEDDADDSSEGIAEETA